MPNPLLPALGATIKNPYVVDFTAQLKGASLSGTPNVAEIGTASVSFTGTAINTAQIPSELNPGRNIEVGKAITFRVTVDTPKADPTRIRVWCDTTNPDLSVEHVFDIQTRDDA